MGKWGRGANSDGKSVRYAGKLIMIWILTYEDFMDLALDISKDGLIVCAGKANPTEKNWVTNPIPRVP
jgi:hypothetical protein